MLGTTLVLAVLAVDFGAETGPVRRELHSSGFGPKICSFPQRFADDIKSMGFKAARTHDWALVNANQRVCDYFHIFPMRDLDASDPKNYFFGPTDLLLKRTREDMGHDVFFRLGTSIEHSGTNHFNAAIPADFDKVAEIFAGTVRHYNRGWANGFQWDVKYWEIWNEPDGRANMWCLPEGDKVPDDPKEQERRDAKRRDLFVRFFVTALKRLKSEFPEIKVGGPALCFMREEWFRPLLKACREAGVAPDFISWHHYEEDPDNVILAVDQARALCDEYGFIGCELILDEWHYFAISDYDWPDVASPDPAVFGRILQGPRAHNGIDASCFNLACLSLFQTSKLDQAYYYGCGIEGLWGYLDAAKRPHKVFHGLRMFGDFLKRYPQLCATTGENPEKEPVITLLAGKSADGLDRGLLVSDYRVRTNELVIAVAGVPADAKVTALVHDDAHDLDPADFSFENGRLVLRKPNDESAAFLVRFQAERGR